MKEMFVLLAVSALLFSCKKDGEKSGVHKGPEVAVHDGKAWSWVSITRDGAPRQLGISLNEAALNSLPTGGDGGHNHENNLFVPLPEKAKTTTLFKVIGLDWNPAGHEPENVYTLPHFDFHFHMLSEAEVRAITDMNKIIKEPAAHYLPANHVSGAPVPQMGLHWLDITSPELNPNNPATFTQTFIYGSYNGKVTFYEPMITLDFLKKTKNFERPIPQPAKFQQAGYYPTKMRVEKFNGLTNVILEGFVYRQAS